MPQRMRLFRVKSTLLGDAYFGAPTAAWALQLWEDWSKQWPHRPSSESVELVELVGEAENWPHPQDYPPT